MRTWTRADVLTICGGPCHQSIQVGDPMLVIRLSGVASQRRFLRCRTCAGEPVPVDLPPLAERAPIPVSVLVPNRPNDLPFDFKVAQAGREPGEDD